jgi:hypothetical protein
LLRSSSRVVARSALMNASMISPDWMPEISPFTLGRALEVVALLVVLAVLLVVEGVASTMDVPRKARRFAGAWS